MIGNAFPYSIFGLSPQTSFDIICYTGEGLIAIVAVLTVMSIYKDITSDKDEPVEVKPHGPIAIAFYGILEFIGNIFLFIIKIIGTIIVIALAIALAPHIGTIIVFAIAVLFVASLFG